MLTKTVVQIEQGRHKEQHNVSESVRWKIVEYKVHLLQQDLETEVFLISYNKHKSPS